MSPILKVKSQKPFAVLSTGLDSLELCHFTQLFHQVKEELDGAYRLENASLRLLYIRNRIMSSNNYEGDALKKFQSISSAATKYLELSKIKIKLPLIKNKSQKNTAVDNDSSPDHLNNFFSKAHQPIQPNHLIDLTKEKVQAYPQEYTNENQLINNTGIQINKGQQSFITDNNQLNAAINNNNNLINFGIQNQQLLEQTLSALTQNSLNNNLMNALPNLSSPYNSDFNNQQLLMNSLLLQSLNQLSAPLNTPSYTPTSGDKEGTANPIFNMKNNITSDVSNSALKRKEVRVAVNDPTESKTIQPKETSHLNHAKLNDKLKKHTISTKIPKKEGKKVQKHKESSSKSKDSKGHNSDQEDDRCCYNCYATSTPLWRRTPDNQRLCNACGLYYKLHQKHRPIELKRSKESKKQEYKPRDLICAHCQTDTAALWRKDVETGETVCNPCGLFKKMNNRQRPAHLYSNVIKKRQRNISPPLRSKGSSTYSKSRIPSEDPESSKSEGSTFKPESPTFNPSSNNCAKFEKHNLPHNRPNTPNTPSTTLIKKENTLNVEQTVSLNNNNNIIINQDAYINMNNQANLLNMVQDNYFQMMDPSLMSLPFNNTGFMPILNNQNFYQPMDNTTNFNHLNNNNNNNNNTTSEPEDPNIQQFFMF